MSDVNDHSDATADPEVSPGGTISPKKVARAANTDDTSTHLPGIRSDRPRESPGPNRKLPGSGKAKEKAPGSDGIPASNRHGNRLLFDLNALQVTPPNPNARRRAELIRSQSLSPTPSRRAHRGLDTGRDATDVSDLEEGQIPEDTAALPARTEGDPANDADSESEDHPAMSVDGDAVEPIPTAPLHAAAEDDTADAPHDAQAMSDVEENTPHDDDAEMRAAAIAMHAADDAQPPAAGPVAPPHNFIFEDAQQAANHAERVARDAQDAAETAALAYHAARAAVPIDRPMYVFGPQHPPAAPAIPAPATAHFLTLPAGATMVDGVLTHEGYTYPRLDDHAATEPSHRHLNPHRKVPAVAPREPTGPADLGAETLIMPNTGDFDHTVISWVDATENMHPGMLATMQANPGQHGLIIVHCGGRYYSEKVPTAVAEFTTALTGFGTAATRTVFPIPAADPNHGIGTGAPNRYGGPIGLGVRVTDPAVFAQLSGQQIIAAKPHVTGAFLPLTDGFQVTWTGAIYSVSIGEDTQEAREALRGGLSLIIWTSAKVGNALQRYALDNRPLAERRYSLSQSIDPRWSPHLNAYVVFMRPCTNDARNWREITHSFCGEEIVNGYFAFKPLINPSRVAPGPRCVICKQDTHFASACPFTKDPLWWGPRDQISGITEGPLAPNNGGGRGRGGAARGRARGRGGRGGRGRGGP